jgi:hypothetical protein
MSNLIEQTLKVEHYMGVIEQEIVNQAIGVIQEKVNQLRYGDSPVECTMVC